MSEEKVSNVWIARLLCVGVLSCGLSLSAADVDVFLEALSIPRGAASTNVYSWTLPTELSVSGQVYRVFNPLGQERKFFHLVTDGRTPVATCCIGRARDSEQAVRELGDVMVFCVQMHMVSYAAGFRPVRNASGDVSIGERMDDDVSDDPARCHRTFGNLYASVRTYTNATTVTAWAVTDALFSLARRVEGD